MRSLGNNTIPLSIPDYVAFAILLLIIITWLYYQLQYDKGLADTEIAFLKARMEWLEQRVTAMEGMEKEKMDAAWPDGVGAEILECDGLAGG
jgi:hypothetical protein